MAEMGGLIRKILPEIKHKDWLAVKQEIKPKVGLGKFMNFR